MADHSDDFERVRERLDRAERKLERAAHRGQDKFESARRKIEREREKLDRRRRRHGRKRSRSSSRSRSDSGARRGSRDEPRRSRRSRAKLTPEERAYRAARARASLKLSVLIHTTAYLSTLAIILLATRGNIRVVGIVGLSWGIGLAAHYFFAVVARDLRDRWVREEVGKRVQHDIPEQRRDLQGRHERRLEDLSASIAHEIRNPITAAKSLVQQMGEDPAASGNIEYAEVALQELDRVERSISHLLRYARDEELAFEDMYMSDVVDSALDTFRDRAKRDGVALERQIDTNGSMRGDVEKLRRVLINLVTNAMDAMSEAGTPTPTIQVMSGENLAGTEVWVRVRDNGPGIDGPTAERIFSPFYTTKDQGTGLGLALSKKIVDAHGGTLEFVDGGRTEFVMSLPKQADARSSA